MKKQKNKKSLSQHSMKSGAKCLFSICIASAISLLSASVGAANNTISESLLYQPHTLHNGWRKDIDALTHFTGMLCPNYIGKLSRSGLVPDMKELGIGCIYETEGGGITVIFRRHAKGTATELIRSFKNGYQKSQFPPLQTQTSQSNVTFQTGAGIGPDRIETFVSYTGNTADYTLWISAPGDLPIRLLEAIRTRFKKLAISIEAQKYQQN